MMGDAEDDQGGSLNDLGERGDGDEVGRKDDVRKVPLVLVLLVHELGQEASTGNLWERASRSKEGEKRRKKEGRWGRGRNVSD